MLRSIIMRFDLYWITSPVRWVFSRWYGQYALQAKIMALVGALLAALVEDKIRLILGPMSTIATVGLLIAFLAFQYILYQRHDRDGSWEAPLYLVFGFNLWSASLLLVTALRWLLA